jgi:hypothetical protein
LVEQQQQEQQQQQQQQSAESGVAGLGALANLGTLGSLSSLDLRSLQVCLCACAWLRRAAMMPASLLCPAPWFPLCGGGA